MKLTSETRIVFVGEINGVGKSSFQRMDTLRRLGAEVHPVDISLPPREYSLSGRLLPRLFHLPATPLTVAEIDRRIASLKSLVAPDIAWFEWPRIVSRKTLEILRDAWPKTKFICFQDDNPFGSRRMQGCLWDRFIRNIPFYDLHFVKRSSDLDNFTEAGAQNVAIFRTGYYEPVFEIDEPARPTGDVLFVGTAMDHRIGFVEDLVMKFEVPLSIRGDRWNQSHLWRNHRAKLGPAIFGRDYVEAIRSHRISLGFVSSSNHDEYTMRSLEIPAAGGFLLAERTPFHQELFEEGREAEFFSGVEECAEKSRFYLRHENKRAEIARAGALRCREAGYGLMPRLRDAWKHLQ